MSIEAKWLDTSSYMKQDTGKASRPELLDPEFLLGVSEVLALGAKKKYAPNRWREGMEWSRIFGALQRHLLAFWSGDDNDPETGLPHLYHAGCCLMFLAAYAVDSDYEGYDDRPYNNLAIREKAPE